MKGCFSLEWLGEQALRAERWIGRRMLAAPYVQGERMMLFLIGHMRTGSSLLAHLLASHRDIMGYGETHQYYRNPADFGATTLNVCRHLRALPTGKTYVLDKVLHERLVAHEDVLDHPSVRVVFLLRRPDESLSSMVRNLDFIESPGQAWEHYRNQVEWIHQLSHSLPPERWTYTTYSELTQETLPVFRRLERFLNLSEPLSEEYETMPLTGVRGVGDSGPHIEAGRVKRNIDRNVLPIAHKYLEPARACFTRCRKALQTRNRF